MATRSEGRYLIIDCVCVAVGLGAGVEPMYGRVLIPIDRSECSQAALEHGLMLAREQRAEVRIIHVIDTHTLYTFESVNVEPIEVAWRQAGQEVLDRAEARARDAGVAAVSASLVETKGRRVASVIVAEGEHWPADLILMGTHGRCGIEHALLGSVAEGVVRASPVPVLLIRTHGRSHELQHPHGRMTLKARGHETSVREPGRIA